MPVCEAAASPAAARPSPLLSRSPRRDGHTPGPAGTRQLVVVADDYGIGPATSRAVLELGQSGTITGTVLLVTSPYAEEAVTAWRRAGAPMELGWHPCLTLDRPILPPDRVPSLVDAEGRFWRLRPFLRRWLTGRLRTQEVAAELRAQYARFVELVGRPPSVVNAHHHVHLFAPVGGLLLDLLREQRPLPYVRRVVEPWSMLARIPGAWVKRTCLTLLGRRQVRRQITQGFPGSAYLAGITDPPWVADPDYLVRWLGRVPDRAVELVCHPGYHDGTLIGRDGTENDGQLRRRVAELDLLRDSSFSEACRVAGFRTVAPSALVGKMR